MFWVSSNQQIATICWLKILIKRGNISMQAQNCSMKVAVTESFWNDWSRLTKQQRERARKKIIMLAENCRHPSLRTHQLHRYGKHVWSCSLSKKERLIYFRRRSLFILYSVGNHVVTDTAHIREKVTSKLKCFFCAQGHFEVV